jgi:hypothetical protein
MSSPPRIDRLRSHPLRSSVGQWLLGTRALDVDREAPGTVFLMGEPPVDEPQWDVFISYASEDRQALVEPLGYPAASP